MKLAAGSTKLKELEATVSTVASRQGKSYDIWNDPSPVDPEDKTFGHADDVKGRLGVHWPWEEEK